MALSGRYSSRGTFPYYVCHSFVKRAPGFCDSPRVDARQFEGLVVGLIRSNILAEGNIRSLVNIVDEQMDDVAGDERKRLEMPPEEGETGDVDPPHEEPLPRQPAPNIYLGSEPVPAGDEGTTEPQKIEEPEARDTEEEEATGEKPDQVPRGCAQSAALRTWRIESRETVVGDRQVSQRTQRVDVAPSHC